MNFTVFHINDKIHNTGGTETYIQQLQEQLHFVGIKSQWLGVTRAGSTIEVKISPDETKIWRVEENDFAKYISSLLKDGDLIHVHTLSDYRLLEILFQLAPVFRSMHEPRMICPAHTKFWRFNKQICDQPFGFHCLLHAYTQGCASRNPQRLISAFLNTRAEIQHLSERYTGVFVMSEYMKREAILAGFPQEKLILNPYFTQIRKAEAAAITPPTRLIFVGRLIEHKGVDLMLEAVIHLMASNQDLTLSICGSGLHEGRYKDMVQKANLLSRIHFEGWLPHEAIHQKIEEADILLFPSVYPEAFGIVGIESMMLGKPVVGFDVGGVGTWLKHEISGILVKDVSAESFKEGILRLLNDPALLSKIQQHGRALAIEQFSPSVHLEKLLGAYQVKIGQQNVT